MPNVIENLGRLLETTKMFRGFVLAENELVEIQTLLKASAKDRQKCRRAKGLQYCIARRLRGFFKNCPKYFERQVSALMARVEEDIATDVAKKLQNLNESAQTAESIDLDRAGRIMVEMHEFLAAGYEIQRKRKRNADKAVAIARELRERKFRLANLVPIEQHGVPGKPVPKPVTITAKDSREATLRGCQLLGEKLRAALAS